MVEGRIININPRREPHYDLLYVSGISDLQRDKLSFDVIGQDGAKVGGNNFATKLDGSWGPVTGGMLHKIVPQKLTIILKTNDGKETLDTQVYAWEGFPKTKPLTISQDTLKAEPKISIVDLISKLDKSLRKVILKDPTKEYDIHDAVEQLFAGTNYEGKFTRDAESIPTSGKSYRKPDFVIDELNLALEVKFCDSKDDVKKIIDEMNADIHPYKKKYQDIIFLVYDLGFIIDVDEFVNDFHSISNVRVVIVKD